MTEFSDGRAAPGGSASGARSGDGPPAGLGSAAPPRLEGTVSTQMARFLAREVRRTGGSPGEVARLPDLRTDVLSDDLSRVPTGSANAMWRYLVSKNPGIRDGALVVDIPPPGGFGLWDYMLTSGPTLMESVRCTARHMGVLLDPALETLEGVEDGELFTISHSTCPYEPDVSAAVEVFALVVLLRRCREATGTPLVPVRVELRQKAPRSRAALLELFGTSHVDFSAAATSLTFLARDARRPLPKAQPGLLEMLCEHAAMTLGAARPVGDWYDLFRLALHSCFEQDSLSLETVAQHMTVSPRTLQRRLAERGSTWRGEVETARQEKALTLLQDGRLPMSSIARRVGYSDVRALRRAVRRWQSRPTGSFGNGAERT
ncbi:AraC family transcriptional regulator [Actinomadura sediminis]|uniref:AraC family transcriptional regulator ligand-binding domain-containing protein n=1 Tax=Actinomadura sediminis TaxID=1038904 RepID=A0ABW3ET11_9ACTN